MRHVPMIQYGMRLLSSSQISSHDELFFMGEKMIEIRAIESRNHAQRLSTDDGNHIHDLENRLYSMAADVFKTYGDL